MWQADKLYAIDDIEDVLNLGINYIVKVGDDLDNNPATTNTQITIRIIPVVADTQVAPSFVGTTPTPLVVPPAVPVTPIVSSGGGCTAGTGQAPFDPVLPMLAALGLVGLVLRRLRRH